MKQRRRQANFSWEMGFATAFPIMAIFLTIIFIGCGLIGPIPVLLFGCAVIPLSIVTLSKGGSKMIARFLKDFLGIRIGEMKTQALADHLKVDFKHVPEHFECVPKGRGHS